MLFYFILFFFFFFNFSFKRNTIKRMCIKTLPPLLCIQLKRFGYDWEAQKALKFDDYFKVNFIFYFILFYFLRNKERILFSWEKSLIYDTMTFFVL